MARIAAARRRRQCPRLLAAGAEELAAGLMQVVGDDGDGALDVAAADRLEETAVLLVVVGDAFGGEHLVLHRIPLLVRAYVVDLAIERDEQRIARAFGDA